ncbi:MAG: pyridoxal phosphate-dependent aminotransferase [Lachnospiraceae bacterium]|nr:pyridoxal phosphate-dependent aminotransferase [Lachnospiraceae bacterium]MCR4733038.1 pyridoxal phosphate-dependent aminotransferase [Lachnospiraceae bacterium]
MINETYKARLSAKSVIRELAEYATARGEEIGYENVFDYSLGNPSVPTPKAYDEAVIRMHQDMDSMSLHGYSPSLGNTKVRGIVADSLKRRFGVDYETKHIFMTSGAAGALAHAIRLVTKPGDEVLTFAPFFPEYGPYVNDTGAVLKVVPARTEDFQINFEAFSSMMNEKVQAVLINSPNNPSGVVYSEETLTKLGDFLRSKEEEYGHDIFLISDEPYREIVFDGEVCPYPTKFYDNTLSCYSYSKSMSLPGERIGYIAVSPRATDADILAVICGQISRGIGHNCPSATPQMGIASVIDETADLRVYEKNRNLLYDALTDLGFTVVKPGGTFYIFPKALEEDAVAFCQKAKKYDLILVPADNFGCPGYFRMAYCIDTEKVERSIPVLKKFVETEYPDR